ncbi:coiled-coil domain-containing protein 117 [Elgaria multicarinata webbii]|uniref:coiled-coil domain-containing protein 117 n=1 Tax=Elgaria multicarinata webbii TaxID=159646 RepID=UPI002FCD23C0
MIRRLGPPSALSHRGSLHRRPGLLHPQGAAEPPAVAMPPGWLLQKSRRRCCPRALLSCRKKHKMEEEEEEPDDCPVGKKRMTEAALGAEREWVLPESQGAPSQSLDRLPGPLETPCEEMEQATGEAPGEAAHRRLQEIEERIIDDDDDGEELLAEGSVSNVPTLILSDTLKTGLKRDYQEVLTKKIIESMSRPSMELVLWKPLPEFLTERATSASVKNFKPGGAERSLAKLAALNSAFRSQTFPEQRQQAEMPSPPLYGAEGLNEGADEEMEL